MVPMSKAQEQLLYHASIILGALPSLHSSSSSIKDGGQRLVFNAKAGLSGALHIMTLTFGDPKEASAELIRDGQKMGLQYHVCPILLSALVQLGKQPMNWLGIREDDIETLDHSWYPLVANEVPGASELGGHEHGE